MSDVIRLVPCSHQRKGVVTAPTTGYPPPYYWCPDCNADLGPVTPAAELKCPGVGRDKDCISALQFYFNRRVTDDEMRFLHDVLSRAVACMPPSPQGDRQ